LPVQARARLGGLGQAFEEVRMSSLKRHLLGDHPFALSSRDFNFYRDFALIWPLLRFLTAAFAYLSSPAPLAGERGLGYCIALRIPLDRLDCEAALDTMEILREALQ
jgi:hypothetical protein